MKYIVVSGGVISGIGKGTIGMFSPLERKKEVEERIEEAIEEREGNWIEAVKGKGRKRLMVGSFFYGAIVEDNWVKSLEYQD